MALFSQDELNSIKNQVEDEKQRELTVEAEKKATIEQFIDETTRTLELFLECMKEYPALAQACGKKAIQLPYDKYGGLFKPRQSEMLYNVGIGYVTMKGVLVTSKFHYYTSDYSFYDRITPVKTTLIRQSVNVDDLIKETKAYAPKFIIDGKVIKAYKSFLSFEGLADVMKMASFTYDYEGRNDAYAETICIDTEKLFPNEKRIAIIKDYMKAIASSPGFMP